MDRHIAISLGKAARKARKALGLTQEQMAERLEVSVEFYGRMERGVSLPSVETFARMVDVLGVRPATLLDIHALRATLAASAALDMPTDFREPAEIRRLLPMLRQARPETLYLVRLLLDEIERASGARKGALGRARKSPPAPSDGK